MRVLRVYSLTTIMRSSLALFTALAIAPLAAFSADQAGGTVLVKDNAARAVIVTGDAAPAVSRVAAQDLQWHIEQASGVRLPIVTTEEAEKAPDSTARLLIGGGTLAEKLGVRVQELRAEEYVIKTSGQTILLAGREEKATAKTKSLVRDASSATRFAVSHLLDRHLGVRWLWPGTHGTYVPKQATIILPPLDITTRPDLVERSFLVGLPKYSAEAGTSKSVVNRMLQETGNWWAHHQLGDRGELEFGHAFTRWWEKYHPEHPDYFAVPPSGTSQVSTRAVKLCTSNPAVIEQIVSEWKAAGMPAVWNVGPNDGIGFCTCARCQSLDLGGSHAAEDVWSGKVNLTARHVAFYNELLRQMRQLAPKTMLCSFAYSAYRNPPVGLSIEKGLALEFVHSYTARQEWQEWSAAGVGLALRPNWLHSGAAAPYLPLRPMGEFMQFARSNGMLMFRFDSLHGYWATQGPNYYLIARLGARPDLTVEDVISEYASAFSAAAPAIHRWLDYWQDYSAKLAITVAAGGEVCIDANGLYEVTCRKYGYPTHPLLGSWQALPQLYDDAVLAKGDAILDNAVHLAANDAEVTARIHFLRDGLRHLRLLRDVIALTQATPPDAAAIEGKLKELQTLHTEQSPRHVVWGDVVTGIMSKRNIKPFGTGKAKAADVKGL
jgi:hypothetical protein